ncbi:protein-disulfide reductase DsbD family protein [Acetobacter oeni]|uniref:Thiol:disulfide interchange protein DsbD n=3 Tax=Acetobacter oeni TaxID=304077 RepID=A0A511XM01_9PROT|nr:thioredoxin family protein [Acetobacter oeni]MBB3882917.1 thiol:disulfide interchange protein DsbD [Acetobacter oeni]GEN63961.1 thiol:disulfide interchange protein DsbD [Acetobacter oeni]
MRQTAVSFRRLFSLCSVLPAVICLLLAVSGPVRGAESEAVTSERDTVTLVSDSDTVQPGHSIRFGLLLHLRPTWHTYWRNPGDAGEAPTLVVTLSAAASGKADAIDWPTPRRLPDGPLMSYGYTGDVLLPVSLTPGAGQAEAGAVAVTAHAEWLVCAAVCVPEEGDFHLTLGVGPVAPSAQAPLFARADAARPLPSPFAATIAPDGRLGLSGPGLSARDVSDAWFIPDTPGVVSQIAPQKLTIGAGHLTLALKPQDAFHAGASLGGVVVLRDAAGQESALNILARPVPGGAVASARPAVAPDAGEVPGGWFQLAVLAFLGGAILNLMPCVFPVLAMKALAVVRMSSEEARVKSALAYTAGVLATFAVLGGATLMVRHAGLSAGWGFQFQSEGFVAAICWLLFAVSLGMLGIFELPVIGAGQSLISRSHGLLSDFLTGLLAVLVATPCTAPFMGAAIAGALAAPPVFALSIFLSMGLGLASPYLLLAVIPGFGRLLPKPGAWMDLFRQVLAFPILATCVWLAWVLTRQGGGDATLVLGAGLLALGFSGWLAVTARSRASYNVTRGLRVAALLVALAPVALLPLLPSGASSPASATTGGVAADAGAFSAERLAALRAEGRPVFIDMTAAWCITCLVNERVTLNSARVRAAFAQHGVVYLKGDWTNRDGAITAFLRAHGRDGVPLYVYYAPHGEGHVLPQILTPELVAGAVGG